MFLNEHHDTFSLQDEIGTCPHIEVHLKLFDEVLYFVHPYAIKQEQNPVMEKETNHLEKLGIKKGTNRVEFACAFGKAKAAKPVQRLSYFGVLNVKLVRNNHAFLLMRDSIQQVGQSHCKVMSVCHLRDVFKTPRCAPYSQKYCRIMPCYGLPTYFYHD